MNYLTINKEHPDLKILGKYLPFKPDMYIDSGEIFLRNSFIQGKGEGYYIRTKSFRYWDKEKILKLRKAIELTNKETKKVNFVIWGTSDYEVEFDNDRSWDAHFTFGVIQKENE